MAERGSLPSRFVDSAKQRSNSGWQMGAQANWLCLKFSHQSTLEGVKGIVFTLYVLRSVAWCGCCWLNKNLLTVWYNVLCMKASKVEDQLPEGRSCDSASLGATTTPKPRMSKPMGATRSESDKDRLREHAQELLCRLLINDVSIALPNLFIQIGSDGKYRNFSFRDDGRK